MTFIRKHHKVIALATVCVALGAGVSAIASAGAAPKPVAKSSANRVRHRHRDVLARAVRGSLVVNSKRGFVTVTFERGVVDSVSGDQLTMTEATRKASYKTVTLTIPANARVRENRVPSGLSALTHGQRVNVITTPTRTYVTARTPSK